MQQLTAVVKGMFGKMMWLRPAHPWCAGTVMRRSRRHCRRAAPGKNLQTKACHFLRMQPVACAFEGVCRGWRL